METRLKKQEEVLKQKFVEKLAQQISGNTDLVQFLLVVQPLYWHGITVEGLGWSRLDDRKHLVHDFLFTLPAKSICGSHDNA